MSEVKNFESIKPVEVDGMCRNTHKMEKVSFTFGDSDVLYVMNEGQRLGKVQELSTTVTEDYVEFKVKVNLRILYKVESGEKRNITITGKEALRVISLYKINPHHKKIISQLWK